MKRAFVFAIVAVLLATTGPVQAARDTINIVGSSTVFPFSTAVAEHFGAGAFKTPKVESTGTGGGLKLFCAGWASTPGHRQRLAGHQAVRVRELLTNGVKEIIEVKIGFDGIVMANSKTGPEIELTSRTSSWPWPRRCRTPGGNAGPQPLQDLERRQPGAAEHQDRGAGPAAHLRHPGRFPRAGHGGGAPAVRRPQELQKDGREEVPEAVFGRSARTGPTSRPARTTT